VIASADLTSNALARPRFLSALVLGVPAVALVALGVVEAVPRAWTTVLALDLWLLSFPHVASTFTRTAFSRSDAREHRGLLLVLPCFAFVLALSLGQTGGARALNTVYFFWQTFHYARQSRGIYRALRRAAGRSADDVLSDCVVYLVSLWALVHRCASAPVEFFGSPLWVPVAPRAFEVVCVSAVLVAFALWALRVARDDTESQHARDVWHQVYLISHALVFVVGYVVIDNPTRGWLTVNIWHNAQYLLFVWAWHHRRLGRDLPASNSLLATMANRETLFFAVCALLGAVLYITIYTLADAWQHAVRNFPVYLVLVHAVNFQHYIADMLLWRSPASIERRGGNTNVKAFTVQVPNDRG
jgi:hypothetical protein